MLIEGLLVFVLRAVLGVFLSYAGVLIGYLLGFLGVFSTPEGVGEGGGLQAAWILALSAGAGIGAVIAWWGRQGSWLTASCIVAAVICVSCAAGWLGYELAFIPAKSTTSESVHRIAWGSAAAVVVANMSALGLYYRATVLRRLEVVFRRNAHVE